MSVTVFFVDPERQSVVFPGGTGFACDDDLQVLDSGGERIAVFAAGHWLYVRCTGESDVGGSSE